MRVNYETGLSYNAAKDETVLEGEIYSSILSLILLFCCNSLEFNVYNNLYTAYLNFVIRLSTRTYTHVCSNATYHQYKINTCILSITKLVENTICVQTHY